MAGRASVLPLEQKIDAEFSSDLNSLSGRIKEIDLIIPGINTEVNGL